MNRLLKLAKKDFSQNILVFIFLPLFLIFIFGIMLLGTAVSPRTMGFLSAEGSFLLFFIPLSAIVLGNRLVVKEYYSRTQLFIESLPISRVEMVLVKYFIGLTFLLFFAVFTLLISSGLSYRSDPVSLNFFFILLSRSAMFCYFVWSFLFAMGFAGKFRIPVYLLIVFFLFVFSITTELNIMQEGPLALQVSDFALERYTYPARQLIQTFLLGSGWLALALFLSLINEGSIAENLAKPMTQREKAVIGIIFIGFMLSAALLESKRVREPYRFSSDAVIASETEPIEILYLEYNIKPDAIALNRYLENKIADLRDTLGINRVPPIKIAYAESLDRDKFETAKLISRDGVLVRANFKDIDDWCTDKFNAYLTRVILDNITRNRTRFAPKQWLHDGFSCWWAYGGFSMGSDTHKTLMLRSMYLLDKQGLNSQVIKEWPVFRERVGEPAAEAVAYSGLAYLQSAKGYEAVIKLVKSVFGRDIPDDSRETLYEMFHPMPVLFKEATGEDWEAFISEWTAWVKDIATQPEFRARLAAIPEFKGSINLLKKEGNIRDIVYEYNFSQVPASGFVCALLHKKISPFEASIYPEELLKEEQRIHNDFVTNQRRHTGKYNSGERVFLALEYESDILGIPVRIISRRVNIE
jgi:ABC-type transport system involved in multi-copper enzyme maturation permease subunit